MDNLWKEIKNNRDRIITVGELIDQLGEFSRDSVVFPVINGKVSLFIGDMGQEIRVKIKKHDGNIYNIKKNNQEIYLMIEL